MWILWIYAILFVSHIAQAYIQFSLKECADTVWKQKLVARYYGMDCFIVVLKIVYLGLLQKQTKTKQRKT